MHPQIAEIVEGLVARRKYIYLCTNALLLEEKLECSRPVSTSFFGAHGWPEGAPRFCGVPRRRIRDRGGGHRKAVKAGFA